VVDSGTFDWSNGRFPSIAEPSTAYHGLKFHETFGVYGLLMKLRSETLRDFGAVLAPFNAFLLLLGMESLAVRMDRHVANALAVAEWLREQPGVEAVRHPALADSPYRPLVDRYLPAGAGSVFSFDLESGREGGRRFIEALSLWSHLANVGDTKSLVIHPASTTHRQLSDEELAASGVAPGTVRLSVGLEDVDDLLWDLERGLRAARGSTVTA
jgi:O-acetylhomoserine (thiol)-lyase